jgi:hypothetical protein
LSLSTTITFDDIPGQGNTLDWIPNGYKGFNWDNWAWIHKNYHPGSGYESGTVSGRYSSFNSGGLPAFNSMVTEFLVIGFYAQSAWVDTNDVVFEGFDHLGIMTCSHTITLGSHSAGPYKIDLSQMLAFVEFIGSCSEANKSVGGH